MLWQTPALKRLAALKVAEIFSIYIIKKLNVKDDVQKIFFEHILP